MGLDISLYDEEDKEELFNNNITHNEKPDYFKQFNPSNGWGSYTVFLPWVKEYLNACREYPEATIYVSR